MKKFKKLLVCVLAVMMLMTSSLPVYAASRPSKPVLTNATMTSTGRLYLSWRSVSNASGYRIRIYNFHKKSSATVYISNKYNVNYSKSMNANTAYRVSVSSYRNQNGKKVFSAETNKYLCTERSLSKASSTRSSLTVKWSKLYGISGYRVYRSKSLSSGYKYTANVSANATSVRINSLGSDRTYFRIVPYRIINGQKYNLPYKQGYYMYTIYY